jgi:hypothetical protein
VSDPVVTPPEEKPAAPTAIAGAAMVVPLFAIVAVGLLGVSAYYAFVQHVPVTQPRVWAAIIGAFYFAWRAAMMFQKYKGRGKRSARG